MYLKNVCYCLLAAAGLFLTACSDKEPVEEPGSSTEEPVIPADPGDADDDALNPNTQVVDYANAVTIAFTDGTAVVTNPFDGAGVVVEAEGCHVVITSTLTDIELNYILSGITDNGSVKIYGEKKFGLVLNGVGITNPQGAAINIQNKKKATVTLVAQTANRLIDGATYSTTDGEDMKGTFFSEGNLIFAGEGALELRGKYKHALCTDGSLTIGSGTLTVKEAASDAIHTNDGVTLTGGDITLRSAGDGIDCGSTEEPVSITGGTIEITTTGEKGHALKAAQNIDINTSGSITLTVYGAASKGLKADGDITILNGNLTANTAGDAIWESDEQDTSSSACISCDGNFRMDDGTLTLLSTGSGGKGINVDGTLTLNGGAVEVTTTGTQYVYDRNNDTAAKGVKSTGDLTINGGSLKITTAKTEAEGLESKSTLTINDGTVEIEAYDDGINAATHIAINGGRVYASSVVNDAVDSNGTLTITGGVVVVAGSTTPETGLDCDQNRFTITGGTIVGLGGDTSTPTASVCTQPSLVYKASAAQIIHIETTSGSTEALTLQLPKTYSGNLTLLFSSPALTPSTDYTLYTGGSISGGSNFHGLYTGATYTKGTSAATFTTGSAAGSVTTVGSTGGGGGWNPGRP